MPTTCSNCKQEIACPDHAHSLLAVEPCETQVASIWVRAVDEANKATPGVTAKVVAKEDTTKANGFAKLEDLGEGKHTVELGLDVDARALFIAIESPTRKETLRPGDLKLLAVKLRHRVKPLLDISAPTVPVGEPLTLTINLDRAYDGIGTLACTSGSDVVDIEPPLVDGAIDCKNLHPGGKTFTIKAKGASAFEGIAFEWKLDAEHQLGDAAVKTATAVKVSLAPENLRAELDAEAKSTAPGLVVHLADPTNARRRAKLGLVVEPPQFVGEIDLAVTGGGAVTLWTTGNSNTRLDLSKPVPVGPDQLAAYFVEGERVSTNAGDIDVAVKLRGAKDVADRFKASVIRTKLVPYADRTGDRKADPVKIADGERRVPGHTMMLQAKQRVQRSKLVVTKEPADITCKVRLVATAGADKIAVYPESEVVQLKQTGETGPVSFENVRELEAAPLSLLGGLDLDTVVPKAGPDGLVLWVGGIALSSAREVQLQLDIDDVDRGCDVMSYTVATASLEIEVVRSDGQPLTDVIDAKLVPVGKTDVTWQGPIPANAGKVTIEVPTGHYVVELVPRGVSEAPMRVRRLAPQSNAAGIPVLGNMATKFELAPKYTHVQFIAHWVYTAPSLGIDAVKSTHAERVAESRADMKAKAALMRHAIEKAAAAGVDLDTAVTTLKVFMAPEFYYRGQQGAYPIEVVSEILPELLPEIGDPKYDDWLFVLGTAVGVVTSVDPVTDPTKQVAATVRSFTELGDVPDVTDGNMPSANLKRADLALTCPSTDVPKIGWAMLTPFKATVIAVTPSLDATKPTVTVMYNKGKPLGTPPYANATFEDPAVAEIANVAIVRKGGAGASRGADGRGLTELQVEKDYVSWTDLPTPVDEAQGKFFEEHHQLIEIFGQVCRAKPPVGSFMPNYFGWSTATAPNQSEVNTSGMGGGSVFTIDDITFGLEVCMDHGKGSRLRTFYLGSTKPHAPRAKSGEPMVQVQLIPSGGMSIGAANVCTVVGGLVFNVDLAHHAAKRVTGPRANELMPMTDILGKTPIALTADASAHRWGGWTNYPSVNGSVILYTSTALPQPAKVP